MWTLKGTKSASLRGAEAAKHVSTACRHRDPPCQWGPSIPDSDLAHIRPGRGFTFHRSRARKLSPASTAASCRPMGAWWSCARRTSWGIRTGRLRGRYRLGGRRWANSRSASARPDTYADVAEMSEVAVEALLFNCPVPRSGRPKPGWDAVAAETRRRGVTLLLLWQGYREQQRDGYTYSQYRRHFRAHQRLSGEPRLRRTPAPASMCEVDHAGRTMVVMTPNGACQVSQVRRLAAVLDLYRRA